MTTTPDAQELFDQIDMKKIDNIAAEYGRVMDWFQDTFPEGRIDLVVNSDQRDGTLNYTLTVMSGKEMAGNQLLNKSKVVINRERFMDDKFMHMFTTGLFEGYKRSITTGMNDHYMIEKEKTNAH